MEIQNSKNVLVNVTVGNVAGNFHVGDTINLYFADGSVQNFPLNEIKNRLREEILFEVIEMCKGKAFFDKIMEAVRKPPRFLTSPPFQSTVFIGRQDELQTVHDRLFSGKAGENCLMLVNGQGGIGKTTFASKYWSKYQDEYSHLAFLYVENGISSAILSLSRTLGLQFTTEPLALQMDILIQTVSNLDKPCLLVLDNANHEQDLYDNIQALQKCTNFHILLTSRLADFALAQKYPLGTLSQTQALQMFRMHYPLLEVGEEPLFIEIFEAVAGNTLVLELLAKNLANFNNRLKKRYTLQHLKDDLLKSLLKLSHSQEVRTEYHAKGTGLRFETPEAILLAMYDLTELEDSEIALLSAFAVLPAENIPFAVLEVLLQGEQEEEEEENVTIIRGLLEQVGGDAELLKTILLQQNDVPLTAEQIDALLALAQEPTKENLALDQTLLALAQKGWIEYNEEEASFKTNPVLQDITRHKNQTRLFADCEQMIEVLEEGLNWRDNPHYHHDNYRLTALYSHYAESVANAFEAPHQYLSVLWERVGSFHETMGNLSKALDSYERANQIVEKLLTQYPDSPDLKNGLAISYSKLGETQASLGNLQEALRFFEERNRLGKELHKAFPDNVGFKNGLAISYSKLGDTQASLGNLQEALKFFEAFNQTIKELHDAFPDHVGFKNGLAISYEKLGETQASLGNPQEALRFFEERNRLGKELYNAFPDNVDFKNGLAISYSKLGETQASLGNLQEALRFFETYNKLEKELHDAFPDHVGFKKSLAVSYYKLFTIHAQMEDLPTGKAYLQIAVRLFGELAHDYPAYAQFVQYYQTAKGVLDKL